MLCRAGNHHNPDEGITFFEIFFLFVLKEFIQVFSTVNIMKE